MKEAYFSSIYYLFCFFLDKTISINLLQSRYTYLKSLKFDLKQGQSSISPTIHTTPLANFNIEKKHRENIAETSYKEGGG